MAAWQVLWIVLMFTTGGLNAIIASFTGFTLFRTACRYSVVILLLVLLWAAERLTAWERNAAGRMPPETLRIGSLTVAAAVCLLVLWDQVPRSPTPEQTGAIARQVESDREFVRRMEDSLPDGAMVFQLPVMEYSGQAIPGIPPYDHFRPYLYSRDLKFSFGNLPGDARDAWQMESQKRLVEGAAVDQQAQQIRFNIGNVRRAVDEIRKQGFVALYINRNGFPDRGRGLADALLELGYDKPPIYSAAGDMACIVLDRPAGK
jgi:phosphoglycerol transferase